MVWSLVVRSGYVSFPRTRLVFCATEPRLRNRPSSSEKMFTGLSSRTWHISLKSSAKGSQRHLAQARIGDERAGSPYHGSHISVIVLKSVVGFQRLVLKKKTVLQKLLRRTGPAKLHTTLQVSGIRGCAPRQDRVRLCLLVRAKRLPGGSRTRLVARERLPK